jgi:starvation-inducible DNA-binding protein
VTVRGRAETIALCNAHVARCIDLQAQVKLAQRNVKGPHASSLYSLFDTISRAAAELGDRIAGRVAQLGGSARGSLRGPLSTSELLEYPAGVRTGRGHAETVAAALAAYGQQARSAIDTMAAVGDTDTSDLFTDVSRRVDEWLRCVEAHRQTDR